MAHANLDRKRWKVSWDIHSPKHGVLYRTKYFRIDEEHLAIKLKKEKEVEPGIYNVKIKLVSG